MAKVDIFAKDWCNIVFEARNREYGAYKLRERYAKNAFIAVLMSILILGLSISTPLIIDLIKSHADNDKVKIVEDVTLAEPPPIDKNEPPPPPVQPPPPLKNTVKFTLPVIVEDKEVKDTMRTQEQLDTVDVGKKTEQGDSILGKPDFGEGKTVVELSEAPLRFVEVNPEFPGGQGELMKFLQDHIKYPHAASDNDIQGTVYLEFTVDKEGKISDIKVLRGVEGGCTEEAIRVVKTMPAWKPGKQNGRAVPVIFTLPVKFKLKG